MTEQLSTPAPVYGVRKSLKTAAPAELGRVPFLLLMFFFLLVYSSLPLMFPVLDVLRPAQTVGGLALILLLYEKFSAGQPLNFASPDGWLLFGFVFAAALSTLSAVWPAYAFEAMMNLVKMTVIYVLILNTVINEKRMRMLMWTMVLCGLFPAVGSLWFWTHGINVEGRAGWVGWFANPNEMAYGLVILIPLAAALAKDLGWLARIAVWALIGFYIIPIYLSFSRGSLLGLGFVFAYMGWRQKSKIARFAMIGLIVAGGVAGSIYWTRDAGFTDVKEDSNFNERLITYQVALAMYADSPIVGVGINCSSVAWPLYAPSMKLTHHKWLITHNTFLEALGETGTIGFLVLVAFFGAAIRRAWRVGRANIPGKEGVVNLMGALEIAYWGFVICGMSGGYVMSWFPYMLGGLIGAGGRLAEGSPA